MRIRYLLALIVAFPAIFQMLWWCSVMVVAMARGQVTRCPRSVCSSTHTWLSKPRLPDLLFPAFVLPHRCGNCERRFFSLHSVNYTRRAKRLRGLAPATAPRGSRSTS
jgi:hypothetical protein